MQIVDVLLYIDSRGEKC